METLTIEEPSEWKCYLNGYGTPSHTVFIPVKGNHPNWFHRLMQELCFGFKWEKDK